MHSQPGEVVLKPARAPFQMITTIRAGQNQSEERVLQTIIVTANNED
jgi:hypothetical protein